ncbi:unnamed protein product, partial [Amoebophrya sp. A120]|eukprot:GSA120T00025924001.1
MNSRGGAGGGGFNNSAGTGTGNDIKMEDSGDFSSQEQHGSVMADQIGYGFGGFQPQLQATTSEEESLKKKMTSKEKQEVLDAAEQHKQKLNRNQQKLFEKVLEKQSGNNLPVRKKNKKDRRKRRGRRSGSFSEWVTEPRDPALLQPYHYPAIGSSSSSSTTAASSTLFTGHTSKKKELRLREACFERVAEKQDKPGAGVKIEVVTVPEAWVGRATMQKIASGSYGKVYRVAMQQPENEKSKSKSPSSSSAVQLPLAPIEFAVKRVPNFRPKSKNQVKREERKKAEKKKE